jgi:hypothetical protein
MPKDKVGVGAIAANFQLVLRREPSNAKTFPGRETHSVPGDEGSAA